MWGAAPKHAQPVVLAAQAAEQAARLSCAAM